MTKDDETKRKLYTAYQKKYGTFFDKSIRQILRDIRISLSYHKHKLCGREHEYGYIYTLNEDIRFADSFLVPIDVAYDSGEIRKMLESSGLKLLSMAGMNKSDRRFLPREWQETWGNMGIWDRIRIIELIKPFPSSFTFVAEKI
jgi:hypothetical protein